MKQLIIGIIILVIVGVFVVFKFPAKESTIIDDQTILVGGKNITAKNISPVLFPQVSDLVNSSEELIQQIHFRKLLTTKDSTIVLAVVDVVSGVHDQSGFILTLDKDKWEIRGYFRISYGEQNNKYLLSSDSQYLVIETIESVSATCGFSHIDITDLNKTISNRSTIDNAIRAPENSFVAWNAQWNGGYLEFDTANIECNNERQEANTSHWQYNVKTGEYTLIK